MMSFFSSETIKAFDTHNIWNRMGVWGNNGHLKNSCLQCCEMFPSFSNVYQVSISSTFYEQLWPTQIPKVQKKTVKLSIFWALSGSTNVKAARRTLIKLTPEVVRLFLMSNEYINFILCTSIKFAIDRKHR